MKKLSGPSALASTAEKASSQPNTLLLAYSHWQPEITFNKELLECVELELLDILTPSIIKT